MEGKLGKEIKWEKVYLFLFVVTARFGIGASGAKSERRRLS